MKTIRVNFVDFWGYFDKEDNILTNALRKWYDVQFAERPDYLFYGDDRAQTHRGYGGVKIQVLLENRVPNFRYCDYAFSYRYMDDPRNLRLPYYVFVGAPERLVKEPGEAERVLAGKTKFCAVVIGNQNTKRTARRLRFFEKLSQYKPVDSGGRFLNNLGGPVKDKVAFLKDYKFHVCFENASSPGYTSEKLVHAMQARCLPVYWGNPRVAEEFNPRSFVQVTDTMSDEEAIERVIELDQDDAKYLAVAREPYFHGNRPNELYDPERLRPQFERIFADTRGAKSWFYFRDVIFNARVKWGLGRP
jgi:hypothetical protein